MAVEWKKLGERLWVAILVVAVCCVFLAVALLRDLADRVIDRWINRGDTNGAAASEWTQEDKENIAHFGRSLRAWSEAFERYSLLTETELQQPHHRASAAEARTTYGKCKTALAEAIAVRDDVLAKLHPELPSVFKERYIAFLKLSIRNMETPRDDPGVEAIKDRSIALVTQWQDWLKVHERELTDRMPTDVADADERKIPDATSR